MSDNTSFSNNDVCFTMRIFIKLEKVLSAAGWPFCCALKQAFLMSHGGGYTSLWAIFPSQ